MSQFKHGLFDCCALGAGDCLLGYFCGCIHVYTASKAAGQEQLWQFLQCFFYPLLMPLLRQEVRQKKNIEGSLIMDVLATWCCSCCASIQIKAEYAQ